VDSTFLGLPRALIGEYNVPAPPEDDRKPAENLPDPELNPMTNTLLAQNMGRWAEVYFTTPPEKRDEAVQELLRELKTGNKQVPSGAPEERITLTEKDILEPKQKFVELEQRIAELQRNKSAGKEQSVRTVEAGVVCPACLSRNRAGQRFCGLCGFTLTSNQAPVPEQASAPAAEEAAAPEPPHPPPIERDGNDWSWLHQRNSTLLAEQPPDRKLWKYVVLVLVLILVIGAGLAYLWWRGNLLTSSAHEPARTRALQGPNATSSVPTAGSREESASQRPEAAADAATSSERAPAPGEKPSNSESRSNAAMEESPSASANTPLQGSDTPSEAGRQELDTARRYLDGRGVPQDKAVAAQWLWKSVAKKNTEAIVLLSAMYAAGDGVPKNCDQARLLLMPAAQKGSQEARERLKTVVASCQ
jgi:hypothetical protein